MPDLNVTITVSTNQEALLNAEATRAGVSLDDLLLRYIRKALRQRQNAELEDLTRRLQAGDVLTNAQKTRLKRHIDDL